MVPGVGSGIKELGGRWFGACSLIQTSFFGDYVFEGTYNIESLSSNHREKTKTRDTSVSSRADSQPCASHR